MRAEPNEEDLRVAVKAEIRTRRRALRRALPAAARAARSDSIMRRVQELSEWRDARTVLAFVSMRTEVQNQSLVEAAWDSGRRVATSRLSASRDDLTLHEWRRGDILEESGMMFSQPTADAAPVPEEEIDLVLVPALAVDERGHRIGFGKGFYDRLLPRLSRAVRVAVAFDFEIIAEVPERPGDEVVDLIVTDARTVRTGARGG